ncbi:mechanosensitive ion channel protein MscS [Tenacibaculum todarodis]|uniref:Mechanosensitive ion channel protein MscS n=1 Tax=Tenacibaculum todarodis TaxID=1850252 RepID=A0A1L3JI04_9FLAO|nr:mechanosensitive ion channel family protein [Tenacibaculum todarodis]APG64732.1 mechanosensitive ion channel protein MscS [Tenacibaculum todarodis]
MQAEKAINKATNTIDNWWNSLLSNLPNIIVAILVLTISFFISQKVSILIEKIVSKKVKKKAVSGVISKIISVIIILAGLFIALNILNLDEALTSLLTTAGIAGAVIGLSLQGTLSNTISGIVLSFRERIKIGNWVETNGFSGEVIDINLKEFVLKEADNNIVIIPNKDVLESPLKNYSLTTRMRVRLECGVGYESDLDKVEALTKETIAKAFDQVLSNENVEFYYTEFGGSSINFLCRFWIDAENSLEKLIAKNNAIKEIKKAFDKAGINIPFPIRTLQFDNTLDVSK